MADVPLIDKRTDNAPKKIIVGVCTMERKANSKPMKAIIGKIVEFYKDWLEFVVFPEQVILNEPVEDWPLCDCLISFYATGFPLHKAIEYERLRRPYTINDLHRQYDLLDRRKVFRSLARAGIDHPRHCVLIRNEEGKVIGGDLKEYNDSIEVNGMIFNKPFVEKPVSAEDHNVYLYFPSSVGSGSQQIFRKVTTPKHPEHVNDRSSKYSTTSTENFIPADGTDVKVYAVGPYYAHAEARKAPGLDGRVERDADGKEIRYPVILSAKEKMIARRVVIAFGQTVCGFDLLRANGKSYVVDVNGFSFVKTSTKYYEDTAKILGNTILRRLATSLKIPWHIPFQADDPPLVSTQSGKIMELRCVLAIIRHGDRTPKQKIKVIVNDVRFFKLFKKYDGIQQKEIKLKRPAQLMEILELIRAILNENLLHRAEYSEQLSKLDHNEEQYKELEALLEKANEQVKTWDQMRTVLEMYGHFSGINRKVQLKYLKKSNQSKELEQFSEDESTFPELLLILKWGGELTTAGHLQAEALGKLFRTLYPGIRRTDGKGGDEFEDTQGLGFLRLHSTYRHDLKIYASDEGRVQMTAAAFAKGLLALEGELTPILMQMVKSANTDGLLNDDYNARQYQTELKTYLHSILQVDRDFTPQDFETLNPSNLHSIKNAMDFIKNPRKLCQEIASYVQRMCEIIRQNKMNNPTRTLYLSESWELAERRWNKELREFKRPHKSDESIGFDISKIPDIYDNIKYDLEHNPDLAINNEVMFERFYLCVKNMADICVPQEYGINEESKISIAQRVCTPLLTKIRSDLHRCVQNPEDEAESLTRLDPRASENVATPMRHVRTRLYFTSESHIHSLMNLLRFGQLFGADDKRWNRALQFLSKCTEFNYMEGFNPISQTKGPTQIVLMIYENNESTASDQNSLERFHIELLFSPGLYPCFLTEKEQIYEKRFNSHKNKTPQPLSNSKKGKNNSTKSSGDQSEKEEETTPLPSSSSNKSNELSQEPTTSADVTTPTYEKTLLSNKQASPTTSRNSPTTQAPAKKESEEETHESDDDQAINLVVLGEVAGKKFSEMGKSTQQEKLPRKRHPSPELKSVIEDETVEHGRVHKNVKELGKCLSTDNEPGSRNGKRGPLKIDTSTQRSKHPNTIVKSMSDILSNRTYSCADEPSIEPIDEDLLESPDSGRLTLDLDVNQATVGSAQQILARDAKEILSGNKEKDPQKQQSEEGGGSKPAGNDQKRPLLATIFSQNTESSESKQPEPSTEEGTPAPESQPAGQITSQNSRDEESNSTRRSRFPYRFKHHTVNLLTAGSGVENRLISTAVLMDTTRRRTMNNPAVLSTAVIARSSSAPRLQTFKAGDEIQMAEIKRFWPPLRSLEALCNISFKQFDQFLERMLTSNTPLPSPPKTPILRESEAENSFHRRLNDTIKRLSMIEKAEKKSSDKPEKKKSS